MSTNQSIFPNISSAVQRDSSGVDRESWSPFDGLTKRELFAAMAMQASLSNSFLMGRLVQNGRSADDLRRLIVSSSINDADALIAELNKMKEEKK